MKRSIAWLCTAVFMLTLLSACGSGGGGGSDTPVTPIGPPAKIVLSSDLKVAEYLSPDDKPSTKITAYVTDSNEQEVEDGTKVYFTVDKSGATITAEGSTVGGTVTADLAVSEATGAVKVTAFTDVNVKTGLRITATLDVPVVSGVAKIVLTNDLQPNEYLQTDGTAVLSAYVTDNTGEPVADGTVINFKTNSDSVSLDETTTTTQDGVATVTLTVLETDGTVTVTAFTNTDLTTGSRITAVLDVPIVSKASRIVLTHSLQPGEYLENGGTAGISAYVTDNTGQPVGNGTTIYFTVSDTGSALAKASATTSNGKATNTLTVNEANGTVTVTAYTDTDEQTGSQISATLNIPVVSKAAKIVLTNDLQPGEYLGIGDATNLTVYVTDNSGHPVVDGTTINFSSNNAGAALDNATATTTDGIATVKLTASEAAGTVTVTASAIVDIQTGIRITATLNVPIASKASKIVLTSNLQTGAYLRVGDTLSLNAYVTDSSGRTVSDGTTIKFTASSTGVALAPSSVDTSSGNAATTLSVNQAAGTVTVTASTTVDGQTGSQITATLSIPVVGPPSAILLTSDLQSGEYLKTGDTANLTAYVTDSAGRPVADGTTIKFTSSASGAVLDKLSATTLDGMVDNQLTIGGATGNVTVTAFTDINVTTGTRITATLSIPVVGSSAKILLSSDLAPGESLTNGASTKVSAYVTDSAGRPVNDGTVITFTTNDADATIVADDGGATSSGIASALLTAGAGTGTITVTAYTAVDVVTGTRVTATLAVQVASPPAKIVLTNGLLPDDYLLPGVATDITAYVTDSAGRPVADGTPITFTASDASGTTLTPQDGGLTANGIARASFVANTATGTITVKALTAVDVKTGTYVSSTVDVPVISAPASMVLTTGLLPGSYLSTGGQTTITAYVTDGEGRPVVDGTTVNFSTTAFDVTLDASAVTADGLATAQLVAGSTGGDITITATTDVSPQTGTFVTKNVVVSIVDDGVASITFVSVAPDTYIGIRGSGQNELADLTFKVLDSVGSPVVDGTVVNFALTLSLHGGESLLNGSAFTVDGEVTAKVQSGYVAGPLRVVASVENSQGSVISTQGLVNVISGRADAAHFGISQTLFNQAGHVREGLENSFNVTVADRFGNVVQDGTPVSFIAECGRIGVNAGGADALQPFELSTTDGVAVAAFETSNPLYDETAANIWTPKDGCTILAYASGQESFDDTNANGVFDQGVDICTLDLGEPFLDENEDGAFTWEAAVYGTRELYIDTNGNGQYDGPNGTCDDDTIIWTNARVTMSSYIGNPDLQYYDNNDWFDVGSSVDIYPGEPRAFTFTVADINGNRLVEGTTVKIANNNTTNTACNLTGGDLTFIGESDQTWADRGGSGDQELFYLIDNTGGATQKSCTYKITITSTSDTTTTGNNGTAVSKTFTVNYGLAPVPGPDVTAPTVSYTVPANGASQVLDNDTITIVFDEAMNPLTVIPQNVTLVDTTNGTTRTTYVAATSGSGASYVFTPDGGFTAGHSYRVTVASAVEDLAGNSMASPYVFNFTSIGKLVEPPRVVFTSPGQGATSVRRGANLTIVFSKSMDATSVNGNVFLETLGGAPVALTPETVNDGTTFVFNPNVDLNASTSYRITVTSKATDTAKIPMDKDFTTTFATGSSL